MATEPSEPPEKVLSAGSGGSVANNQRRLACSPRRMKQVLLDLSQTATINDSIKLAKAVLAQIGDINTLHRPRVEQAGFAVLKAPDIPSILVETAFISNPGEERQLSKSDYQDKMADAILAGIRKYFAANPPLARAKIASNP